MIGEFFIKSIAIKRFISEQFNDENDKILDLGCGRDPKYHSSIKGKIICLDKFMTNKVHLVGDAEKLPFKRKSFDKIISVNSFYYFNNPFDVTDNMGKILKDGGKLAMVVPFFYPIHDAPDDKFRFTKYDF